jgi:hypothetical protein
LTFDERRDVRASSSFQEIALPMTKHRAIVDVCWPPQRRKRQGKGHIAPVLARRKQVAHSGAVNPILEAQDLDTSTRLTDRALGRKFAEHISGTKPCFRSVRPSATRHSATNNQNTWRRLAPAFSNVCPVVHALHPGIFECRGSRKNPASRAHVGRCRLCFGGLGFGEKLLTQTQLAVVS